MWKLAGLGVLEVVREKIFRRVAQEIPYSTSLELVGWTDLADGSLKLDVDIYVGKKNHEKILIGKNGQSLAIIRTSSEQELSHILGRSIKLILTVRGVKRSTAASPVFSAIPSQREQSESK